MLLGTLLIGRTLKRLYGIRPQAELQAQLHKFRSMHAVSRRVPADESADPELLARPLRLQPSGRVVRNRLMKAPLTEYLSTYDAEDVRESGLPTQRLLNLYSKFGRGRFGLLLTGNVVVDPLHYEAPCNSLVCAEAETPERRRLFQRLAANAGADGALVVMQINHAGPRTPAVMLERPFVAWSGALSGELRERAVELSVEQIRTDVVDRFVYVAHFAHETGFDGVQVHLGYGWLLAGFLSTATNKRTDEFGGSVRNRLRVVQEIRDGIRSAIRDSAGFIVGLKLNSPTFEPEWNAEETAEMIDRLDAMGFDFVELTGGSGEKLAPSAVRASTAAREAFFDEFLSVVRPHFKKTTVFLTGGYRTVAGMTEAIRAGKTDGISLGRPVAAEPDLPRKILEFGVKSAAYSDSEMQNNFQMAKFKANSQLGQASRTAIEGENEEAEAANVCAGISDFSDPTESKRYEREFTAFLQAGGLTPATFSGYFDYAPPC
ncbi:hypothetical protein M3Y99_01743200 [Aphelenchoides fujianensis]|nr:hypothetical protein M3Y99_01743200 [Aphelenchoides fujianensis]